MINNSRLIFTGPSTEHSWQQTHQCSSMQKCITSNLHTENVQNRKVRHNNESFNRNSSNVSKDVNTRVKIKRFTTAYGLFFREYYTQLKLSYPSSRFGKMSRLIASKWRRLNQSERMFYKSQVKKREYSTNYGLFFHEEYAKIKASDPNATFGEISNRISRMWYYLRLK